jgi:hypothetical protein
MLIKTQRIKRLIKTRLKISQKNQSRREKRTNIWKHFVDVHRNSPYKTGECAPGDGAMRNLIALTGFEDSTIIGGRCSSQKGL